VQAVGESIAVPGTLTRALVRTFHRALLRLRGGRIRVVYDPSYARVIPGVPFDPLRGEKILASLLTTGLLDRPGLSTPRPATLANVLRVHTPDYLERLSDPLTLTRILGVAVTREESDAVVEHQRLQVGGTIQATRLAVRSSGIAAHLGGGFHHARSDAGLGFCVFNDVAVAIRRLRSRGFAAPILVVDLDLHDGNGTRAVFADDATVHTYSVHNADWGPTDAVASTSIALGADVEDARLLGVVRETLPPLFASFRPGLVFYVAGTDGAAEDPVGNWRLSAAGIDARDRYVTALAREGRAACPLVVVLAGGYGPRAWRHTARYLLWAAAGREVELPPEEELSLQRFRGVAAVLGARDDADDGLAFTLEEQDLAALVPGAAAPPLFLGTQSRHEVELLLERAGVLPQLRARGFPTLRVELDAREGPHTVRVRADDASGTRVLVEVRAERSRRAVPGLEVIALEWLLLQNPREAFSSTRPRLPGQQHPGLGLLRDVMSWLVVLCERQSLDGVFFTASHYHIAMQSRRIVRPLDPADEARLLAFAAALEPLPLAEATTAVAQGRVVDAHTGRPAEWRPVPMVLPVSPALRERVDSPAYDAAVARERGRLDLRLAEAPTPA